MSETLVASDWANERGKKWCDDLPCMEAMLVFVDAPLIEALQLDRPLRIADIGCGGGGTTLEILAHAPAGSCVHGFDISQDLVELARTRIRAGDGNIAFHLADVGSAMTPLMPYDRLVSRFGIMFFDNPAQAFANLACWLAPGGRFAFAVWGPRADNPWITGFSDAVGGIIDAPPPDREAPGPLRYGGGETLLALLDAAGLSDLGISDWRGLIPLGGGLSVPDTVDFTLNSVSASDLLVGADETTLSEIRQRLKAHYTPYERDGAVWMDGRIHIVTGRSPA